VGAAELAAEMGGDLRRAAGMTRQLVYGLRPPMLDELGLVAALRNLEQAQVGPALMVYAPEPLPPLPAAVEVAIYRIASEALHNAIKHASATRCQISLCQSDHLVMVEISDDGVGVPPDARGGVGLHSMAERAAELGGTCVVTSGGALGGTTVVARLPLEG
ncbi:MAG: sensor histidine kinase, partial [Anaerolineae bacterium]|nr:sensor histidine kinase [Anaerolineae bacterium]